MHHQKIDHYSRRGQTVRFCQRCAVGHPIEEFDGTKGSCRQKLEKFNSRRRKPNSTATKNTTLPSVQQQNTSATSSAILSGSASGASFDLNGLDSLDLLGFDIGELLPVDEEFNLDVLLADVPATEGAGAAAEAVAVAEAGPVDVSAANSINCNERVCCTTMDAECMCCQSCEQQQHVDADVATNAAAADDGDDDASPRKAAAPTPATSSSNAALPSSPTPTAEDCDDSDACISRPSHNELVAQQEEDSEAEEDVAAPSTPTAATTSIQAAAAAAKLEAEFAALQATDAAMYAMIVHQQMMQARLLLSTTANALLLQRARSASMAPLEFSRKESFGEISHMVM